MDYYQFQKWCLPAVLYQFEIGVCQQSIKISKLVSNSHQYQFWNWCLPAININFEIGVCQQSITILKLVSNSHQCQFWNWCLPAVTHFHLRLHIWNMCFKHIHTLYVFVICNEITYDLSLLQVQFSSRSGTHKSWNFSQFQKKNCSTVNSRGNSILKMVLASNLYQFQIGVCQQF